MGGGSSKTLAIASDFAGASAEPKRGPAPISKIPILPWPLHRIIVSLDLRMIPGFLPFATNFKACRRVVGAGAKRDPPLGTGSRCLRERG